MRLPFLWIVVLIACALPARSADEGEVPYEVIGDQTVDTNGSTIFNQILNPPMMALNIPVSPAPSQTFDISESNLPPDCAGAVSSSNVVTMINFKVQVNTDAGVPLVTNFLRAFWTQSTNIPSHVGTVYDPVVVFDRQSRRFIATAANNSYHTNAGVLVGVSMTEDPRGSWNMRWVKADTSEVNWGDQPHIGFDSRFIAISVNMLQNSDGGRVGAKIFVFR